MAQYPTHDYPRDLREPSKPTGKVRKALGNSKCECPKNYRIWNDVTGCCTRCCKPFTPTEKVD